MRFSPPSLPLNVANFFYQKSSEKSFCFSTILRDKAIASTIDLSSCLINAEFVLSA